MKMIGSLDLILFSVHGAFENQKSRLFGSFCHNKDPSRNRDQTAIKTQEMTYMSWQVKGISSKGKLENSFNKQNWHISEGGNCRSKVWSLNWKKKNLRCISTILKLWQTTVYSTNAMPFFFLFFFSPPWFYFCILLPIKQQ